MILCHSGRALASCLRNACAVQDREIKLQQNCGCPISHDVFCREMWVRRLGYEEKIGANMAPPPEEAAESVMLCIRA